MKAAGPPSVLCAMHTESCRASHGTTEIRQHDALLYAIAGPILEHAPFETLPCTSAFNPVSWAAARVHPGSCFGILAAAQEEDVSMISLRRVCEPKDRGENANRTLFVLYQLRPILAPMIVWQRLIGPAMEFRLGSRRARAQISTKLTGPHLQSLPPRARLTPRLICVS